MATSLKFGTSGLRGLVTDLAGPPAGDYTRAFLEALFPAPHEKTLLIGRDLRASSPDIARLCAAGAAAAGWMARDCGALPTPALALAAMTRGLPAIMVTGSHIPDDRNGLKFYRPDGEIDKDDEARIAARHAEVVGLAAGGAGAPFPAAPFDALADYRARYLAFFGPGALDGLTVGVYEHSSVARDLLVDMLEALGARAIRLGRATKFVPVDTEAIRPEDRALAAGWTRHHRFDALVSTDGDADRPLVAEASGAFLRGDLIGAITARALGVRAIVTPVTSNSGLERCGAFDLVARTRVGSPFVIAGIAAQAGHGPVIGFEANGGVLLGSDVAREGRSLAALPTRDALLPILCALSEIRRQARPLAAIAGDFGFSAAASDRLENTPTARSEAFLARLRDEAGFAGALLAPLGGVATLSALDGVRLTAGNGETVHFRASGNAPELRAYVEAADAPRAQALLAFALDIGRRGTA